MMRVNRVMFVLTIVAVAVFLGAGFLRAEDKTDDGWVDLFNGKNLDGWTLLKCEAEVKDGDILITKGNGLVQSEGNTRTLSWSLTGRSSRRSAGTAASIFTMTRCRRTGPGRAAA